MSRENLFITVDGIDRCGKSTLVSKLKDLFWGSETFSLPKRRQVGVKGVSKARYPSGRLIDLYLKKHLFLSPNEVSILMLSNLVESQEELSEMLQTKTVICDRYVLSNKAYDMARGLTPRERNLLKPDFQFLILASPDECSKRKGYGEEALESLKFQRKVDAAFRKLSKEDNVHILEGNEDEILSQARKILNK